MAPRYPSPAHRHTSPRAQVVDPGSAPATAAPHPTATTVTTSTASTRPIRGPLPTGTRPPGAPRPTLPRRARMFNRPSTGDPVVHSGPLSGLKPPCTRYNGLGVAPREGWGLA